MYACFLFLMHGHSFERIWTKFGMYMASVYLRVVMGRLARATRARAGSRSARRLYTPLQMGCELHGGIRN